MKKCIDKAAIVNILHKLWKKDTGFENIDIVQIAYNRALQDVQKAIDSKQEEPVSERFTFKAIPRLLEMIEPTDRAKAYIAKPADTLEVDGYLTDAKIVRQRIKIMNGEKVPMATMDSEPVSEDKMTISKEWFEYCKKSWYNEGYIDGEYNRDRQFEEPVSEGLEKAAKQYSFYIPTQCEATETWKKETEQHFIDGAKWQLAKNKSITLDDLEEFINELSKQFPEVSFAKVCKIATRTAKWLMLNSKLEED